MRLKIRPDVAWFGLKGMRLDSTSETCEHYDGSLVVIDSNDADNTSKEDKNAESLLFNKLSVNASCMNIHTIEKGTLVKP